MVDESKGSIHTVTVLPKASLVIAGHCQTYPNEVTYGILLGCLKSNSLIVVDALPVSHGAPSLPLAETALGLAELEVKKLPGFVVVLGWYTAPMLLEDTPPGPVALRLAAGMASSALEPILLVVQNKSLGECVLNGSSATDLFQALGRDFGNQWLQSIVTKVENADAVGKAILQVRKQELAPGIDLLDNMGDVSKPWYPNKELSDLVKTLELS